MHPASDLKDANILASITRSSPKWILEVRGNGETLAFVKLSKDIGASDANRIRVDGGISPMAGHSCSLDRWSVAYNQIPPQKI